MKLLVTGVYGLIGWASYKRFKDRGDETFALARRRESSERVAEGEVIHVPDEQFFLADLTNYDAVRQAVDGMDVVVQMAADPRPNTAWENILNSNMIGAYNVFEACRDAGVKRIVYASSIMTNWGYWEDEPYKAIREGRFDDVGDDLPVITVQDPPRPTEPYSASKVWGEALARTYSDTHSMSCICIRIGWVNAADSPEGSPIAPVWCSQRDIVQMIERCVDAPESLRFDIFYGISNNAHCWVDVARGKEIGFEPLDKAEEN
jgi:nucleoside-diphosphate-sugar epimerase